MPDIVPFQKKLRVSGFPYCGLKHMYEVLIGKEDEETDATKSFYCDVGTAAHLVFQRWLGTNGSIYGDWKCRDETCPVSKPENWVRFSNNHTCPKCGKEMEYEEFTVGYGKHCSGHIDGVWRSKDGSYWVIDYKTSSVRNIQSQRYKPTFPYEKNRVQIMSYCALIEKIHNIKISGWMLLYIARDDPFTYKVVGDEITPREKKSILKSIGKWDDQYGVVKTIEAHKGSVQEVKWLIETKICKDYDFYERFMKGFKGCPLESVCFTKKLNSVIKGAYLDHKEQGRLIARQTAKLLKSKTVNGTHLLTQSPGAKNGKGSKKVVRKRCD